MRNLATIQEVLAINPIDGADAIEVATIKGWQVVVKKGEFNVGDSCVYVEIDSLLPEHPEFEFMRSRGFRVKTIKLKKQVSQGICFPITILNVFNPNYIKQLYPMGCDVTELLGITKYLSPSEKEEYGKQEKSKHWTKDFILTNWLWKYKWFRNYINPVKNKEWPENITHTDENRVQNFPQVLEEFKDEVVYITEKVDFQSVTFTSIMKPIFKGLLGKIIRIKKFKYYVCSRNMVNNDKGSLYWKISEKYGIEKILRENPTITIQGEQGDTKVQGNKYGITEPKLWVFNIIDYKRKYHFNYDEMKEFCDWYGLDCVPLLTTTRLGDYAGSINEIVEKSKGKSVIANIQREGIVVRCIKEGKKVLSFKVINPDFLLKYSE